MDLINYVVLNRHKTFEDMPFNEVDGFIYAQMAYYNFSIFKDGIRLGDITKNEYQEMVNTRNLYEEDETLMRAIISSDRFKDVIAFNYVSHFDIDRDEQFAAITFNYKNKELIVAFRGTDGTVTGWKEDLNLTYMEVIPAQDDAERYLKTVADFDYIKEFKIVGHSKGGNLAVYAASNAKKSIKDKISVVYNFDGPGFRKEFYDTQGYLEVRDRIQKFSPKSSAVGRLMYGDKFIIIESSADYLFQHWGHSWIIEKTSFKRADSFDSFSETVDKSSKEFVDSYTKEERKEIVDTLFDILSKANCFYMDDIFKYKEQIPEILKAYRKFDSKNKSKVLSFLFRFMFYIVKNYVKVTTDTSKRKFANYINSKKTK